MDSSDNITSETNGAFGDGICDPDLEARLYAEIYYSNETYVQDFEAAAQRETERASSVQNVTLSMQTSVPSINHANVNPVLQKKKKFSPGANFFEDHRQGDLSCPIPTSNFEKTHYRAKDSVFGNLHGHIPKDIEHCNVRRIFPKSSRLLTHKDLWLTQETAEEHISIVCGLANVPSESAEICATKDKSINNPETIVKANNCPIYRTAVNKQTDNVCCNDSCRTLEKCAVSKKKRKNAKKKSTNQILTNAFRGTKILRQSKDAINSMGVTIEMSKYRVVSKKKKLKMREANPESVEISSDSDDSILEVPVPPKAQPVVIQLPDSDEDCDRMSSYRREKNSETVRCNEKELTPCYNIDTDSSQSDESSLASPREPSPSKFDEIHHGAAINAASTAGASSETIFVKDNNLILNCTDLQQGASSIKEIRKIRETGMSSHTHSDDSMTESEASNWGNIAAGQANSVKNKEICLINESTDRPYGSLWDQLTLDNPTGVVDTNEDLMPLSNNASSDETIDILKNDAKFLILHCGKDQNKGTKRKRQKDGNTSSLRDLNLLEIPEKRNKENTDKSSIGKSFTEYFFKPMSKELQAFYNNPWGGENLDVYDIQSRMPRNPSCWAILDADLGPPLKRRGRVCPRCRTNSHFGKRCPEKLSEPICCMCGTKGHIETRCPQTMCLTCGHKYTTFRPTCGYCSKLSCNMCKGRGHTPENCPDLWRRYHDTTTETLLVPKDLRNIMKSPQYLSCCNCSKTGHDVTTCRQLRWSQHFPTPMYVSSYSDTDKNDFNDCSSQRVSQDAQSSTVLVNPRADYAPMLRNFAMGGRSNMIATSSATVSDIHLYIEPRTSSKSVSSDGFHSPNSHQTLLLNHYRKAKQDCSKNIDNNEGLLVNLKRQKRKLYRRSARAAIKLANSSNISHLQKMAHALKLKMIDCSIRTDDVRSLQNAISTNLGSKKVSISQRSPSSRKSQTVDDNQAHKKFLQNL